MSAITSFFIESPAFVVKGSLLHQKNDWIGCLLITPSIQPKPCVSCQSLHACHQDGLSLLRQCFATRALPDIQTVQYSLYVSTDRSPFSIKDYHNAHGTRQGLWRRIRCGYPSGYVCDSHVRLPAAGVAKTHFTTMTKLASCKLQAASYNMQHETRKRLYITAI